MLAQMRQFERSGAKIITKNSPPNLALWLAHFQGQRLYFQNQQLFIGQCFALGVLGTVLLLASALVGNNEWLWLLGFISLGVTVALGSYFGQLSKQLARLTHQYNALFEKAIRLKTTPWLSVGEQLVSALTSFLHKLLVAKTATRTLKDHD